MKMVTEDYVSFEIAKLLKEKGFNADTHYYYSKDGDLLFSAFSINNAKAGINDVIAPTLQMAMKWLRNKHDIVCSVVLFIDLPPMVPYWSFNILDQSTAIAMYEAFDVKCETYEEAAEAAIKYCLEKLI